MNCPQCKSDKVLDGMLVGYGGVAFVEEGTQNKLRPNAYKVRCSACTACGAVFDLHIITTGKKKVGTEE